MAKVDIIIATYNRASLLPETLMSVQEQTFKEWRCWISEDGETPETISAIEPFLQDNRFVYLPGYHCGFPSVPRNRAITEGVSRYIAFLDDDDLWAPEKLEQQLEFLESAPECVLLGSNAVRWSGDGSYSKAHPLFFEGMKSGWLPYESLVNDNKMINSSVVIRRSTLKLSGLLNENPELKAFEDYEFWLRVGVLGKIYLLENPLVIYRDLPNESIRSSSVDSSHLYSKLAAVYKNALVGVDGLPSSIMRNTNHAYAVACKQKLAFYNNWPASTIMGKIRLILFGSNILCLVNVVIKAVSKYNLIKALDNVGHIFGGKIIRKEALDRFEWESNAFYSLLKARIVSDANNADQSCECIIFSMDRAMQLHACIGSLLENIKPSIPICVLYHATTENHLVAYDEVKKIYKDQNIRYVQQINKDSFRGDLINILEMVLSMRLFFLVDDIIFTNFVNLEKVLNFKNRRYVPSLRMGMNLNYCYTMNEKQGLPTITKVCHDGVEYIEWKWSDGKLDWNYPLSVDGHIFNKLDILNIAKNINYSAPNSFEAELQNYRKVFLCQYGVSYKTSRIVNIPCNKVQTENSNICGEVHQDELLDLWNKGLQIDYRKLKKYRNTSAHQEIVFDFIGRK